MVCPRHGCAQARRAVVRYGAAEVAEGACCCGVGAAGRPEAAGEGRAGVEVCCCAEAALQGWSGSHSQCAVGGGSGSCSCLWSKSGPGPGPLVADSGRAYQGQQAWAAGSGGHTARASGASAAALVHASRSCSGTVSGAPQPAAVFRWPCCVRQGRLHVREQNEGGGQV